MWKNVWKLSNFHTLFTHFSQTFHMNFTHMFHTHVKFCIVKYMWKVCNMLLTCKFTHIFTYTANGVSHGLSHAFNPHWMAKDLEFHMLLIHTYFHIYFTWGFTWAFTCKSPVVMNGNRIPHATSHKLLILFHTQLFS